MKPITWTERSVRLACDGCGAHTLVGPGDYVRAVARREQVPCGTCGRYGNVRDRRSRVVPVPADRRLAAA